MNFEYSNNNNLSFNYLLFLKVTTCIDFQNVSDICHIFEFQDSSLTFLFKPISNDIVWMIWRMIKLYLYKNLKLQFLFGTY